jgi:hypothetical protein
MRNCHQVHRFLALGLLMALQACSCHTVPAVRHPRPLGQPCAQNSDCQSNLCGASPGVDAGAGGSATCQQPCSTTLACPKNQICVDLNKQVDGTEAYACAPAVNTLCQPCANDNQCGYSGSACLAFGTELDGGAYTACGQDCGGDGQCPAGWKCTDAFKADGKPVSKQCVPVTGTCACTEINRGMTISCQNQNQYGTCLGVETCDPSQAGGFVNCTAKVPAPQTCYAPEDHCSLVNDLGMQTCGTGDCVTTVPLCAPDGGKITCEPKCTCAAPSIECGHDGGVCTDVTSDPNNCGGCGIVCSFTNANSACVDGGCVMLCKPGFADCDHRTSDGCEVNTNTNSSNCGGCGNVCSTNHDTATCSGGSCVLNCQTGYGDCDQDAGDGCETNLSNTLNDCGTCGNACSANNDVPACMLGICSLSCDVGFADCNQDAGDGCEVNLENNVNNCGACGNACTASSSAAVSCDAGQCVYTCLAGYVTTPGFPPGSCNCHFTGNADAPDVPGLTDSNCDGIDGTVGRGVFVDKLSGDDANDGGMAWPLKTVQAAINLAASQGKTDVYISKGTYDSATPLQLADSVSLYGGYDASNQWQRSVSNVTTLSGSTTPVQCSGVSDVTLQLLTIFGQAASTPGTSAIALNIQQCTSITLDTVTVRAGDGAPGADGADGVQGDPGSPGADGNNGFEDDSAVTDGCEFGICNSCSCPTSDGYSCSAPSGGLGGVNNSCPSANGGQGGAGGWNSNAGSPGIASTDGVAGGQGTVPGRGDQLAPANSNGHNGADGQDATTQGQGGASIGTLSVSGYTPSNGGPGQAGTPGQGGGGGGGGGGGPSGCSAWGGGGGGGGAGGCGGTPGQGGQGGGASIALLMVSSQVQAINSKFLSGAGGKGGNGGQGGPGRFDSDLSWARRVLRGSGRPHRRASIFA